jgi:D-alanyl-lipoteichoic acid acyltransferase DltB (MBOAT superfamily)
MIMLFNSYIFIFAFLPGTIMGFYLIGRTSPALATLWLAAASLFFYGWWDVRYLMLLLGSIAFNYAAGYMIGRQVSHPKIKNQKSKIYFVSAIAVNLSFLIYFKYANFFVVNLNHFTGSSWTMAAVVLPLGISFFTFTQIAFLVDTYQGKVKEFNFLHYTLFVTYFPHLIAGPVLHHAEMMPQFARRTVCHINWDNMAIGLSIFVLGLAKKVLLADTVADYSTPVFEAIKAGSIPMMFEAWAGALAYTLQIYFDFSAYSDMAIGLSLMFNVRLPLNFNSPYKATSIIDFWRCWHMTLSRFLRDYLYIPLGGSRLGISRRYINLILTMLLGGLWHGAGWTFVIWGSLHGFYLLVNHAWREGKSRLGWRAGGRLASLGAGSLTFLTVVVGWVFFRADSYSTAVTMLLGMAGLNGVSLPTSLEARFGYLAGQHPWLRFSGLFPLATNFDLTDIFVIFCVGFTIVWLMPNMHQIFQRYWPVCEDGVPDDLDVTKKFSTGTVGNFQRPQNSDVFLRIFNWKSKTNNSMSIGIAIGFLFAISLGCFNKFSPFLYFQF